MEDYTKNNLNQWYQPDKQPFEIIDGRGPPSWWSVAVYFLSLSPWKCTKASDISIEEKSWNLRKFAPFHRTIVINWHLHWKGETGTEKLCDGFVMDVFSPSFIHFNALLVDRMMCRLLWTTAKKENILLSSMRWGWLQIHYASVTVITMTLVTWVESRVKVKQSLKTALSTRRNNWS